MWREGTSVVEREDNDSGTAYTQLPESRSLISVCSRVSGFHTRDLAEAVRTSR